ncbi:antigen peptide transporter 1 [Oreochromis niloticus]|uniref:Antigen peptide transporter 1 n=3 Tax=Oreochromis TaxID=8139 RepID=I3JPU7_ORENI|nr:antigen peptide transporter 1 [Oreochromis niloticus]XP_005472903.1 antigen peptide transporter 1 [Oreochromis niloticus]XP_005472904.1 antigen peptide transporter 1 [Oreochromis niloticus]XP_031584271.2 antigen peptide transporter 1 [Oreochromis aureus]XP_031584272.2 antigen peptide transporter 1 [Oreochromis aureus]
MQKMSYFFPVLCVCLDVCVVHTIRLSQLSPLLLSHPFIILWGGALTRASVLAFLAFTYPGSLPWTKSFEGLQSLGVLCFHFPVYATLLWVLGQSTMEELWGWHSWERVLQGYIVTVVAWLYWSRYVSSLLISWGQYISSFIKRTPSQKPKEETGASLKRLMGYMQPFFWRFVAVLILVFLSSYGEMAIPQYTGRMADWIMNEEAPDAFTEAITIMTLMTIASAVLEFICDLTYNITMSRIHTSVQGVVFQAVLKQEIAFFDATSTGELVSRITTDTNSVSEALSEELSLLMWYTARFGFLLFYMVSQSWKMTLLTCMGLPIIWVIPKLTGRFHQTIAVQVQESLAKANQVATETFSNMKTVRSFANEDGETEKYRLRLEDTYALNKKEAAAYAASTWANSMTTLALKVCILYYGGTLVTRGAVSSGDLVSFVLYELQFASAVEAVMRYYPQVKKAIGASEKIFEYLDRKPQVPPDGTLAPENLQGHIQFKNVTFSYNKENLVLKNISLEVKPGQITALVGLNRSGKSTCVKLLERFYQPIEGEILLDGKPLNSYKDQYLHDKIAVVSQECVLFARSVRENIKYGYEHVSDEDMYRAANLASAHKFIMELPNKYDTDAGEKGGQVSGGQKQRIAIARALIRRPKVLILDNATSDLDTENEYQVHQALMDQAKDCSVLLISNKMSVVEKASHIIVIDRGMVKEEGNHEELMNNKGLYASLVEKQNKSCFRNEEESN